MIREEFQLISVPQIKGNVLLYQGKNGEGQLLENITPLIQRLNKGYKIKTISKKPLGELVTIILSKDSKEDPQEEKEYLTLALSPQIGENISGGLLLAPKDAGNPKKRQQLEDLAADLNLIRCVNTKKSRIINPDTPNEQYVMLLRIDPNTDGKKKDLIEYLRQRNIEYKRIILGLIANGNFCEETIQNTLNKLDSGSIDYKKVLRKVENQEKSIEYEERIYQIIQRELRVTKEEIRSKHKKRSVALARAIMCFLLRENSNLTFPEIARRLGNKNHATVILANQRFGKNPAKDYGWKPTGDPQQDYSAALEIYKKENLQSWHTVERYLNEQDKN